MKVGATKQQLVSCLESTLKLTRENIVSLTLESHWENEDTVVINFENGRKQAVSIRGDSGIAIVRDVSRAIDY